MKMAKGRMLNRKIATDEKFNALNVKDQWLYMRMLPFMDDYGRMTGNLFELKYQVIPSCDLDTNQIQDSLMNMQQHDLIYFKKDECIQFRGFNKNQKIGHRKAESLYPDISEDTDKDDERSEKVVKGQNNIIEDNIIEKNKTKSYRAKPKDLEMVIDYFKKKNVPNAVDNATKFYNHYEAGGWMRGRTKIKNWKLCLTAWDFKKDSTKSNKELWRRNANNYIVGYCEKCGASGMGNTIYEIKTSASCCGVQYLPTKPKARS